MPPVQLFVNFEGQMDAVSLSMDAPESIIFEKGVDIYTGAGALEMVGTPKQDFKVEIKLEAESGALTQYTVWFRVGQKLSQNVQVNELIFF